MEARNDDQSSGSEPDHGYVDQDDEPEAAKEHEGPQEMNTGTDSLDAASDGGSSDTDQGGHGAQDDLDGPTPTRGGLGDQNPETD